MNFEFATAGRIVFGRGRVAELSDMVLERGSKVFMLTGQQSPHYDNILGLLGAQGLYVARYVIDKEPTIDLIVSATQMARAEQANVVVGIGGGSIIDSGKAVSAMLTNPGNVMDYLEVIGRGQKLTQPTAPYIAVPTTSGTGAEVTRNAVLGSTEHQVKVSMRSPLMLPDIALIDPELTQSMPPQVTANSGLDALTQLIEAFVSSKATPLTDGICLEGLKRGARSLLNAFQDGDDISAREDMSVAAVFSGLALANAGLGAVHGFAGPLGGLFPAPHGGVCARLLPFVMQANVAYMRENHPDSYILSRYDEIARIVTGSAGATADDGVEWVRALCIELEILPLSEYGLTAAEIPRVTEQAKKASSMKGNPVQLPDPVLHSILEQAL